MSIAHPTAGPPVTLTTQAPDSWLALIWHRARQAALQGIRTVKVTLARIASSTRDLAATAVSLVASRTGYDAAVRVISATVRGITRVVEVVVRFVARPLRWLGTTLLGLIRRVSPAAAETVQSAVQAVVRPVRSAITWVAQTVTGAGQLLERLAHTDQVATATTTVAKVTGIALLLDALTGGTTATAITTVLPQATSIVAALLNPWTTLGVVVATFAISAAVTFTRAVRAVPAPVRVGETVDEDAGSMSVADEPQGIDQVARQIQVTITTDGAINVTGLPASLPDDVRQEITEHATQAAQTELHRSQGTRPRPNATDRKKATRAARRVVVEMLTGPEVDGLAA